MELTTWVKRRQSNTQAVTQVKRLSSVKCMKPRADKVRNLEGNSRQSVISRAMDAGDLGGVKGYGMSGKGSTEEPGISF